MVAAAAHDCGDANKCYRVAVPAVHALAPGSSSFLAFQLNMVVIKALQCGALGPTWSCRQVAPFVINARAAGERLRRWMMPVIWDESVGNNLYEFKLLERVLRYRPQA